MKPDCSYPRVCGASADLPQEGWRAEGLPSDLPEWTTCVPSDAHRVVVVPGAVHLDPEAFTAATHSAYETLLHDADPTKIARVWNFIPHINDQVAPGVDRYMAFNAGRFGVYEEVFEHRRFHPVASGVGHVGEDLVLHALHGAESIKRISNDRQTEPHAYSQRFGTLPPAFSRAATVTFGEQSWFLVSGTASVVGEASHHVDDACAQTDETIENLYTLLKDVPEGVAYDGSTEWLAYVPNEHVAAHVVEELMRRCNATKENIIVRRQALCRPELLVEIECAVALA